MRTKLIFAAMAALALISCRKEMSADAPASNPEASQEARFPLTVNVGRAETRATTPDTPEESKISSIQILVFRADGSLDAYKNATASPVTGVSCTAGPRNIYAVVNFPASLSAVKTLAELNAKVFAFSNEALNGFQMIGKTAYTITATAGTATVTVDRAVAKIHIGTIKTDFQAPAYQTAAFTVNRIYAINVVANYAVTYPATVTAPTINKAGLSASLPAGQAALLTYVPSPATAITNGAAATTVNKNFYVYPNFSTADADKTRIVVEATLAGKKYYYPLTFSATIKNNTYYDITSLTIRRPGSDSPNVPVVSKDCDFTVLVSDWTTGETMNTTI